MNNNLTEKSDKGNDKSESFLRIPTSFLDDERIKSSAFVVYAALVAFRNTRTGRCFPSVSTIMKRARLSKDAVRRSLNQLEGFGWIERRKEKGKSNNYLFPLISQSPTSSPPVPAKTEESDDDYLTRKQSEFPQHNVPEVYADFLSKCGSEKYPKMKPSRRKFDQWLQNQDELMPV